MRHRGRLAAVAAGMGMLVLGGCDATSSAPPEEGTIDADWVGNLLAETRALDGLVGSGSIGSDRDLAADEDLPGGISWDFPQLTTVTGATVTCDGDADLTVEIKLTGRTTVVSHVNDVPCDREPHRLDLDSSEPLMRVSAHGSGPGTTRGVVEIEGATPTDDTWVGALDVPDRSGVTWALQTAGTFGPTGQVTPFEETALDVPAGAHTVEVDCDGPSFLEITADVTGVGEAPSSEPVELTCPGSTTIEVTTTEPGLVFRADSADTPGAVRFRVDEGVTYPAP